MKILYIYFIYIISSFYIYIYVIVCRLITIPYVLITIGNIKGIIYIYMYKYNCLIFITLSEMDILLTFYFLLDFIYVLYFY